MTPRGSREPVGRWDLLATVLTVVWFAAVLYMSLAQYETGHNRSFDLGLYARSLWGLANGYPINSLRGEHALAIHSHFILYLLAPLTAITGSAYLLIFVQTFALAASGLLVYHLAKRFTNSEPVALSVLVAYVSSPIVINTALYEVHVKTFATPFLLLASYRLLRRGTRDPLAWLSLALAFASREETALQAALLGLFLLRGWDRSLVTSVGLAYFVTYYFGIRPWLGGDTAAEAMHFGSLTLSNLASHLFTARHGLYLAYLAAHFGFASLLAPRHLAPAVPIVAINLMSTLTGTTSPNSHYSFLVAPFLALAAMVALGRLGPRLRRAFMASSAISTILLYFLFGQGPGSIKFEPIRYEFSESSMKLAECAENIPKQAPIMAPSPIVALFAERPTVKYKITGPAMVNEVDYFLLERRPLEWILRDEAYLAYIEKRERQRRQLVEGFGFREVATCGDYALLTR